MVKIFIQVVLVVTVSRAFGKYVYVPTSKTWTNAQQHCRHYYTELAPISGPEDDWIIRQLTLYHSWIGLYREPTNMTGWKWSGGGYATYLNFKSGQPDNEWLFGSFYQDGWYDTPSTNLPFICLRLLVVREPKTWADALEFCREQHTDLASLLSETEMILAHREVRELARTKLVWTGLRFLGDRWLWVNGDHLNYQAWPPDGGHLCPASPLRCGAVGTAGPWVVHNCQEKLNFICY